MDFTAKCLRRKVAGVSVVLAVVLAGLAGLPGAAEAQSLTADGAWARATAPHQDSGVVYLTLHADKAVAITSVASPAAGMAMLHRTSRAGGMSSMRDVDRLEVGAGQTVRLAPGGLHIMLMGLHHPLMAGEHVGLTLGLSDGTSLRVDAPVQPLGASGPPG
jgi:copper(I)-binding protein